MLRLTKQDRLPKLTALLPDIMDREQKLGFFTYKLEGGAVSIGGLAKIISPGTLSHCEIGVKEIMAGSRRYQEPYITFYGYGGETATYNLDKTPVYLPHEPLVPAAKGYFRCLLFYRPNPYPQLLTQPPHPDRVWQG